MRTLRIESHAVLFLFTLFLTVISAAQDPSPGIQPLATLTGGPIDIIDMATSHIQIVIPIREKMGKMPFSYKLVFNPYLVKNGTGWSLGPGIFGGGLIAARPFSASLGTTASHSLSNFGSCNGHSTDNLYDNWTIRDATGAVHNVPGSTDQYGCVATSFTATLADHSGYTLVVTGSTQYTIYDRSGNAVVPGSPASTSTDPDGSSISFSNSNNVTTFTDSLQQTVLTAQGTTGGPYSFTDASGTNHSFTVSFASFPVKSNFVCPGMADEGNVNITLPTTISTPDGGTYTLSYEQTPGFPGFTTGRIASISLPTGGSISYGYSGGNNGINCNTTVVPTLTRTVSDNNGHTSKWTYVNSKASTLPNFTVTQTDPVGNVSTYSFSGEAQTQRVVSDVNLGTLVTRVTCYNQNYSSQAACVTPSTLPGPAPSQTDVYDYLGTASPTLTETKYDIYGNVTEIKKYGVGATYPPSGTPVVDTTYVYGSWSGTACVPVSTYIHDRPCSITAVDSSGATVSQTRFTYNAAGHATQISRLVGGSTFLSASASYNANGTIATSTDANNAVTHYFYDGVGGCNNLLLTSTVLAVNSFTASQTWDCNGGVITSTTDPNGQVTHYGYLDPNGVADPLWRLGSVTDPLGNVSTNTYSPNATPPTTETAMVFNNGISTADLLTTFDGIGHPILKQTKQSPTATNYDTVPISYDLLGRQSSEGIPCVSTASVKCSSSSTTTTYDALNRPLQITDAGGGYTQYTYASGGKPYDLLVTTGPASASENLKQRQLEYDGLHRLKSVCEITSATGSGTCAQANPKSGYWTQYTYDAIGRLTGVSQNAQGSPVQTRAFTYDSLSRLTSEVNPEWNGAATSYVYESDPSGICIGTYAGDLIRKTDPAGNVTCSQFDALHRQTFVSYPAGPNASATPAKFFQYDTPYFGSTGTNIKGRLVAAVTCQSPTSCAGSAVANVELGYSPRGELTDVWELTPHSAGFYHSTASYFPNGALQSLGGIGNFTAMSYGLDGEGRLSTALHGTNRVVCDASCSISSTSYNAASQPLKINIGGTNDNDTYTYDANTGRMSSYAFTTGATPTTITGAPAWNPNGTLKQLAISDGSNSNGTQTCSYNSSTVAGYDDLARLLNVNCVNSSNTTIWSQSFSYDPFGNITKSGSLSWMPGYNQSTNRYNLAGTSYDADGNVLKDTFHTYTRDSEGQVATIDSTACGTNGTCLTYDAFGRMVEKNVSGTITEVMYSPAGKTAVMSGQTISFAYFPLPGGATEIEMPGGTHHFLHKDWLGSARFVSTVSSSSVPVVDRAFAPFGEVYEDLHNTNEVDFTGDTQEILAGLYDTPNRELHPKQGRWLSPDPAGLDAADPTNPQSWNRYAYVENRPLTSTDPSGLILGPQTPSCNESASCDGGYSHDPSRCDPNDIFCAPDPARGAFGLFPHFPFRRPGHAFNILPGQDTVFIQLGSGNPITDIWQDALGLPSIPCQAQFGPWCDPSLLPNPWILDGGPKNPDNPSNPNPSGPGIGLQSVGNTLFGFFKYLYPVAVYAKCLGHDIDIGVETGAAIGAAKGAKGGLGGAAAGAAEGGAYGVAGGLYKGIRYDCSLPPVPADPTAQ